MLRDASDNTPTHIVAAKRTHMKAHSSHDCAAVRACVCLFRVVSPVDKVPRRPARSEQSTHTHTRLRRVALRASYTCEYALPGLVHEPCLDAF